MAMKPAAKAVLLLTVGVGGFFGLRFGASHGYLPANLGRVLVPKTADIPDVEDAQVKGVTPVAFPTASPVKPKGPAIRIQMWEWNAQLAPIFANGGAVTMKGSIAEKNGVTNVHLIKNNDTNQMVSDLVSCAQEIHGGAPQCSKGTNMIVVMGDQYAEVAAQANAQLKLLGPEYLLRGIWGFGYSRGEDACMTPKSFKDDPKSIASTVMLDKDGNELPVHGLLIAGSVSEGDWDICMKGGSDNAIPNNPNPKTFDATAMNWFPETDYTVAGSDYVAAKCDERDEVIHDDPKNPAHIKLTGKKVRPCINSVATWTPVDVTVALQRGGLVKAFDSAMYRGMMPALLLGSGKFMNDNRKQIKAFLKASSQAADQIKAFPTALQRATEIEAKVYDDEGGNDENGKPYTHGAYWLRYFHPVMQMDKTQVMVSLGGSAVSNLADNLLLFGFNGNTNNAYATYSIFREINLQQYPERFKPTGETPLPFAKDAFDRSFVKELSDEAQDGDSADAGAAADTVDYSKAGSGDVVSKRDYSITFATGAAQPLPDGEATLHQVLDSIAITALKVQIDGYTDNTGSDAVNTALSKSRADEVKAWLQAKAHKQFPDSRFVSVEGHGPADPVGDNNTPSGKAANRRVKITLIQ